MGRSLLRADNSMWQLWQKRSSAPETDVADMNEFELLRRARTLSLLMSVCPDERLSSDLERVHAEWLRRFGNRP